VSVIILFGVLVLGMIMLGLFGCSGVMIIVFDM